MAGPYRFFPLLRRRRTGLRVFLLAGDFTEKSFLLAVKQYKPASTLTGEQVGGLVRLWAEQALAEYGLDWTMVAGAVTDGGSDLKFAFRNIPGVLEEGCIAHMLNRATIDGFGMSCSPAKCTNTLARQGIAQVRKVAEHMSNSNAVRKKLANSFSPSYSCIYYLFIFSMC